MERYPTEQGIAVSPYELWLPESRKRGENNHHVHFTARRFGRLAVTQALRDLERHQYMMPMDVHEDLHRRYGPPEFPTEEQAAREVMAAYEQGERFKCRNRYKDIPLDLVDGFIARYGLKRVY